MADLRLCAEPAEVLPGVWTTGEIHDRPEPEGGSPNLVVRQGEEWQADRYRDDMSMVLETSDGLVLLRGCCHAGLLNTLALWGAEITTQAESGLCSLATVVANHTAKHVSAAHWPFVIAG
jgi:metal-dependent hydrolase (beta-lactamase superfamily II)